jgi:hypothetical protein
LNPGRQSRTFQGQKIYETGAAVLTTLHFLCNS